MTFPPISMLNTISFHLQVRKTVTINPTSTTTNGVKSPRIHLKCISKSHGGGTMLRVLGAARKREVKATQNLSIIVLFFMVCWLPLYTQNCIVAFCPECYIPPKITLVFIVLSHLNSAVNPLLYAYHLKDFRAALQSLICNMLGIKIQQADINYRFSHHSQNRITTLFDKRNSSLQPKKYIGRLSCIRNSLTMIIIFYLLKIHQFGFDSRPKAG